MLTMLRCDRLPDVAGLRTNKVGLALNPTGWDRCRWKLTELPGCSAAAIV
jgi:hypothetical protein